MLLVVVEDALYRLNTRVLIALIVLASALLIPIEDLSTKIKKVFRCTAVSNQSLRGRRKAI